MADQATGQVNYLAVLVAFGGPLLLFVYIMYSVLTKKEEVKVDSQKKNK